MMRQVNRARTPVPSSLAEENGKGQKELLKAAESLKNWLPVPGKKWSYDFEAYGGDDVKAALETLFHGKCAYCESRYAGQAPVDVEHYRPKGEVADEPEHKGYWWLAMAWSNLLPSCIDCDRRRWHDLPTLPRTLEDLHKGLERKKQLGKLGKQDLFPIEGSRVFDRGPDSGLATEKALLLEPTTDNPAEHLKYHLDEENPIALVLPRQIGSGPSKRGIASIHVYGLNRLGLVQERTRILQHLIFLAHIIQDLDDAAKELRRKNAKDQTASRLEMLADRISAEIGKMAEDDQPFCSLVRAWLEKHPA